MKLFSGRLCGLYFLNHLYSVLYIGSTCLHALKFNITKNQAFDNFVMNYPFFSAICWISLMILQFWTVFTKTKKCFHYKMQIHPKIMIYKRPWKASPLLINATKTHWKYLMKFCEPIYFLGICIQLSCVIARWLQKAFFCFPPLLLPKGIGSRWNPITFKLKDPLCPPRYHLSVLIKRMWSYLVTTKKVLNSVFKVARIIYYSRVSNESTAGNKSTVTPILICGTIVVH